MLFSVQLCGQLYQPELLNNTVDSHKALVERAIVAFRNDTVDDFSNFLVEQIPGAEHSFEPANYMHIHENAAVAALLAVVFANSEY